MQQGAATHARTKAASASAGDEHTLGPHFASVLCFSPQANVQAVLTAADKAQQQRLLQACEDFIVSSLTGTALSDADAPVLSFDRSLLELLWRNNLKQAFGLLTGTASGALGAAPDQLVPADMLATVIEIATRQKEADTQQVSAVQTMWHWLMPAGRKSPHWPARHTRCTPPGPMAHPRAPTVHGHNSCVSSTCSAG